MPPLIRPNRLASGSLTFVVLLGVAVGGCTGAASRSVIPGPASPSSNPPEGASGSPIAGSSPTIRPVPSLPPPQTAPPSGQPVTGEVPPDVMAAARADLAVRIGAAAAAAATEVRTEARTWPDGSLGCPVRGETYIQVPVEGYWIVLAAGGRAFDYRATSAGLVRLCEGGPAPAP